MSSNKEKAEEKIRSNIISFICAYANTPLRGHPEKLLDIYKIIDSYSIISNELINKTVKQKIAYMVELSELNDPQSITEYIDKNKIMLEIFSQKFDKLFTAFPGFGNIIRQGLDKKSDNYFKYSIMKDVYGYYIKGQSCPCSQWRADIIDNTLFKGPDRLKCFECDQELLINILLNLPNSKINILQKSRSRASVNRKIPPSKTSTTSNNCNNTSPIGLIQNSYTISDIFCDPIINFITQYSLDRWRRLNSEDYDFQRLDFPDVFGGLLSYLLITYLNDPKFNHKRLKRCVICSKFFPADDSKREKCYSSDCERKYKRKQQQKRRAKPIKPKNNQC